MASTLEVCLRRLTTQRATLLCAASSLLMFFTKYGSKIYLTNSSVGLTRALYACSLIVMKPTFRFLLKNPRVLLALLVMLVKCESRTVFIH